MTGQRRWNCVEGVCGRGAALQGAGCGRFVQIEPQLIASDRAVDAHTASLRLLIATHAAAIKCDTEELRHCDRRPRSGDGDGGWGAANGKAAAPSDATVGAARGVVGPRLMEV